MVRLCYDARLSRETIESPGADMEVALAKDLNIHVTELICSLSLGPIQIDKLAQEAATNIYAHYG